MPQGVIRFNRISCKRFDPFRSYAQRKKIPMKFPLSLNKSVRIATPALLALLLAIALLPGVALATPPGAAAWSMPSPVRRRLPSPPVPEVVPPPPVQEVAPSPPVPEVVPPPPVPEVVPSPPAQEIVPHPSAPNTPPADCIVAHAATPVQLCPISGGLQYYFIGTDGSSQTGPYIQPFSELATLHTAGAVSLYSGINPLTSKSVHIDYLPADQQDSDQHLLPGYHVRHRQALYLHGQ